MKRILPILLPVLVLIFIILSVMLPSFASDAIKKQKQLDAILLEEKNLPALADLLSKNSEKILLFEQTFPTKEQLISVVQAIDTLATSNKVSASLHFETEDPQVGKGGASVLPVSLTVQGDFTDCIAFLTSLQKNRYLFSFDKIEGTINESKKTDTTIVAKGALYVASKESPKKVQK